MGNVPFHHIRAGVGKVRLAGQIRPTETFLSGPQSSFFNTRSNISHSKVILIVLYLLKTKARRAKNIFETARGQKNLPTPVLEGTNLKKPLTCVSAW